METQTRYELKAFKISEHDLQAVNAHAAAVAMETGERPNFSRVVRLALREYLQRHAVQAPAAHDEE